MSPLTRVGATKYLASRLQNEVEEQEENRNNPAYVDWKPPRHGEVFGER